MTLAETQALFHATVTGGDVDPSELERWLAGSERLPAAARVGIYAEMWFWRQVEALRAEFPALSGALGEERFAALCREYLEAHPSEHHDIGRLGGHLAAFLRGHPTPERSDLGDLAELEWARSEVFFAAEMEPVGREALADLGPAELPSARLRLVPALRLLSLQHPAHLSWEGALRGQGTVAAPDDTCLVVWRRGDEVFHAPVDPVEAEALRAALDGSSLVDVCGLFEAAERPAEAGFVALASWVDECWIGGVETSDVTEVRGCGVERLAAHRCEATRSGTRTTRSR